MLLRLTSFSLLLAIAKLGFATFEILPLVTLIVHRRRFWKSFVGGVFSAGTACNRSCVLGGGVNGTGVLSLSVGNGVALATA